MTKKKKDTIKSLAIHKDDVGSTEIQIGLLTDKIAKLSEHFKKFKKDKHSTIGLTKSVNKRKKLLNYLKNKNVESYQNVIKQLNYDKEAKKKGITIVPDCGMGPGINVSMGLLAIEQFDKAHEVRIWDGGLPQNPVKPWNYSLFFNIAGLTNEYDSHAFFIRNGKIDEVNCFEDYEVIDFGGDIGQLEASVTSGGLSTMPWTFQNKLKVLENKTLRYLGHWEWMKAYRELGLFNEDEITFNGHKIVPRDFYHHLLKPHLDTKDYNDICIMRVKAIGILDGKKIEVLIDALETFDDKTNLMAMEKWTGWHASIVMQHIMNGNLKSGTFPIEKALTGKEFYSQAMKRNYKITINKRKIN